MEQIEVINQETDDQEYVFNDFPFDTITKIIEDVKQLTDKINENPKKYYTSKKGDLELLNNTLKNYDKNNLIIQTYFRQCLINTYSESKKNFLIYKKNKKKSKNKDNLAVNKLREANQFILDFIPENLKSDGKTSTAYILKYICNYAKEEIKKENPDIFVYNDDDTINRKSFKVIGLLLELFVKIQEEAKNRNQIIDIPEKLAYTQIMGYIKFCFPIS